MSASAPPPGPDSLPPGTRVRLHGLVARPDLNGTIAVVLEPESGGAAVSLAAAGRVRLTCTPAPPT